MSGFDADLRRLYDELGQLDRHIRDFDRRLQEQKLITWCAGCDMPTVVGGVCGCDIGAAVALAHVKAQREQAA